MFRIACFVCVSLCVICCDRPREIPFYNTADFTPQFLSAAEANQKIQHRISDFSFVDQHGKRVDQSAVAGKIHVANFFFTRCGLICPRMTDNMKLVQDAFANDPSIVMLSYSVTPWLDDTAALRDYAQQHGVTSPQWHLLTGSRQAIYQLARQSYFAEEELGFTKDSTQFLHTEHFLLVDGQRRLRGVYNGTLELDVRQLIEDIRLLRKEKD